jgi:hypothetical protein
MGTVTIPLRMVAGTKTVAVPIFPAGVVAVRLSCRKE